MTKKIDIENELIEISKLLITNLNFSRSLTDVELIDSVPTEDESCAGAHMKNELSNRSIIFIRKEMVNCETEKEFIANTISTISHELYHLLTCEIFEVAVASEIMNEKMSIMIEEKTASILEEMVKNSLLYYPEIMDHIKNIKKLLEDYDV